MGQANAALGHGLDHSLGHGLGSIGGNGKSRI